LSKVMRSHCMDDRSWHRNTWIKTELGKLSRTPNCNTLPYTTL
jgi:hypothetical protein